MAYLVDSDWLIDYLDGVPEAVVLLGSLTDEGVAFSVVTYMEAFEGTFHSDRPELRATVDAKMRMFPILGVSEEVARQCARIRFDLRAQGRRVRTRALDLLVAATALEYDLTLVARNRDDFRDVPGLRLYEA